MSQNTGQSRWKGFLVAIVILVMIACYFASGFYFVEPNERAIVRRFGAVVDKHVEPGLHYALPWPICRVDKPRTTEIRRVTVGLDPVTREAIASGDLAAQSNSLSSDVFTGDVNIVKVTMVAQYQVVDPVKYVTSSVAPDELTRLALYSVMIEEVGGMHVDEALTAGKAVLQEKVRGQAQDMIDDYGCGIGLLAVDLQAIDPPFAIIDAFKDVASAKKDREKEIDKAVSYSNSTIPRARGQAFEIVTRAETYYQKRVNDARGKVDRFRSIYEEYVKAPYVTRLRLLLATLTRVFEEAELYVYSPNSDGPPLRITLSK